MQNFLADLLPLISSGMQDSLPHRIQTSKELGLVVHACNPNTRETEPGGLPQVRGQSGLTAS